MTRIDRRTFMTRMTASTAVLAAAGRAVSKPFNLPENPVAGAMARNAGANLAESAFRPLPLGSIAPADWLRRQLRIQAQGLSGHLDEFWPDVGENQWLGGQAEGWERAPYWLDGVIPLAWLLDDERLKTKVSRYIDYIVLHQREDGWFSAPSRIHHVPQGVGASREVVNAELSCFAPLDWRECGTGMDWPVESIPDFSWVSD